MTMDHQLKRSDRAGGSVSNRDRNCTVVDVLICATAVDDIRRFGVGVLLFGAVSRAGARL